MKEEKVGGVRNLGKDNYMVGEKFNKVQYFVRYLKKSII